jgi:hypothetical protein
VPNKCDPSTTIAFGEGLNGAIAGRVATFTIQAKDVHGNDRLDQQPREQFQIDIFQPGTPPTYPWMSGEKIGSIARRTFTDTQRPIHIMGNVSYIGKGAYEVKYFPEILGLYTTVITMAMQHEIQTVTVDFDTAYGRQGTYTLNYGIGPGPCPPRPVIAGALPCNGETTESIAWDADALDIKIALEKLSTVDVVDVSRLPYKNGYAYNVTFVDVVGDARMLIGDKSALKGANPTLYIAENTKGTRKHIKTSNTTTHFGAPNAVIYEKQDIALSYSSSSAARGGSFKLAFNDFVTKSINWNATDKALRKILVELPTIGDVFVTKESKNHGNTWHVTFLPDMTNTNIYERNFGNVPSFVTSLDELTGPGKTLQINTIQDGRSPFDRLVVVSTDISPKHSTANDGEYGTCTGHCTAPGGGLSTGTYQSISSFTIQARDKFSNAIPRGPIKETQILKFKADAGTFSLIYRGLATTPLSYKATTKEIEGALEKIQNVGAVSVYTLADSNGYSAYQIVFDTRAGDLPALKVNASSLSLNGSSVVHEKIHYCDDYRVQRVRTASIAEGYRRPSSPAKAGTTIGGSFRLRYNGAYTIDMQHNVPEGDVKKALEALPDIVTVSVQRSIVDSQGGYTWTIELLAVENDRAEIYAEGHLLYALGPAGEYGTAVVQVDELREGEYARYCEANTRAGRYGDDFVVRLEGPDVVQGDVKYLSKGLYRVTYETPKAGDYSMSVMQATRGGLSGEYFNNRWLYGTRMMSRIDESINFIWKSYITPTGVDYISIRWTGYVKPSFTDKYTFYFQANDGVKLWIDEELIIDQFEASVNDTTGTEYVEYKGVTGKELISDRLYPIKIEFRENTGVAHAHLFWESFSQVKTIVPSSALYYKAEHIRGSPFQVVPRGIRPSPPLELKVAIETEKALKITWRPPANYGGTPITKYSIEWYRMPGTYDVQTIKMHGATGGKFVIKYGTETTGHLAYNERPVRIEWALQALEGVEDVKVTCANKAYSDELYKEQCNETEWRVEFVSRSGARPKLVIDDTMVLPSIVESAVCQGGTVELGKTANINCFANNSVLGTDYDHFCMDDKQQGTCGTISGVELDTVTLNQPSPKPMEYIIHNLPPGVLQYVRVKAFNVEGYGMPCAHVTGTPMAVPNPPAKVSHILVAGSSTQIKVYWDSPPVVTTTDVWGKSNGRNVTEYNVEWDTDVNFNSTSLKSHKITPFVADSPKVALGYEWIIPKLTKGVQYYIRVSAQNEMGYGKPLNAAPDVKNNNQLYALPRKATDTIAYGEVVASTVDFSDETSVFESVQSLRVVWSPPASEHGANVSAYLIEWFSEHGRNEVQVLHVSGTSLSGTFFVKYLGYTTDLLTYDISADDMTLALEGLPSIRTVEVNRENINGNSGFRWYVTFTSDVGDHPTTLELDGNGIAGNGIVATSYSGMNETLATTFGVVKTSATVTSSNNVNALGVVVNDYIQFKAGHVYQVKAINIAGTSIELVKPYEGETDNSIQNAETGRAIPGSLPERYGQHTFSYVARNPPYMYIIKGLTANILYNIRVSAKNERGLSPPRYSLPLQIAPPKQKPSEPLQVELTVHTATSLRVFWHMPESDGADTITKYKIEWDTSKAFNTGANGAALGSYEKLQDAQDCVSSPCSHVFASLTKGTTYYARVYSYNSFGYSVNSGIPVPEKESPKTTALPPKNVHIVASAETSLDVFFSQSPDDGGAPVTKYLVEWDASGRYAYDNGATANSILYEQQEVQIIKTSATMNDLRGTFRIKFETETTKDISYQASANDVKEKLEALPTVGKVFVVREENDPTYPDNGYRWIVTFLSNVDNLAEMEVSIDKQTYGKKSKWRFFVWNESTS